MAMHTEALGLSGVHIQYSKCNPSLGDTRYSVLDHINTFIQACAQSVDNLFRSFIVLWKNEYFLTSNRLCSFASVKLCPLILLQAGIYFEKTLESIISEPFDTSKNYIWEHTQYCETRAGHNSAMERIEMWIRRRFIPCRTENRARRSDVEVIGGCDKGLCKEKTFQKSEITMEVGGWVQVSLGIFFVWKIVPK